MYCRGCCECRCRVIFQCYFSFFASSFKFDGYGDQPSLSLLMTGYQEEQPKQNREAHHPFATGPQSVLPRMNSAGVV